MQNRTVIRPFRAKDARALAEIVVDTWGFDEGIRDRRQGLHIGYAYLYSCMQEADFCRVAELDGRVVGIILGRTMGKRLHPVAALKGVYHAVPLVLSGTMHELNPFFDAYMKNSDLLDRLSGANDNAFDAEIALFIISKDMRGRGIGGTLYDALMRFFREKGVTRYYVHTDTACTYRFYEHRGMKRAAEVQTDISYAGVDNVRMFVYANKA